MLEDLELLDGAELARRLPMAAAVDALEAVFAGGEASAPPRVHAAVPGGTLLVMPASSPALVGVKLVTVTPGNPNRGHPLIHGLYIAFDVATGAPSALVDGAALTALRTAAVSGLATRHLARPDSTHLVVLGAGTQARSHVAAMRAVRPIDRVTVVSRTRASADRLVDELRGEGISARVGDPTDVGVADLVCACTTSDTPVVAGTDLSPGAHVNAVGAYTPTTRELDTATMQRGRIVVEDRDAALAEDGDLAIPVAAGDLSRDAVVADLAELVTGTPVRRSDDDVTVFTSVGLSIEDLAVVAAALAAG
ncbi:ornithine cyclodeaminase family protein [Salsipaludibacter albus]|uniref:ornithine cyclodeaminase family protein n=1 Tax=Salsipaludibacter albus TaxID=2849650 RepID=UPI001EE3F644|nr:ornithine cyclodeaminase family protein [Salsipaludibacter albus]